MRISSKSDYALRALLELGLAYGRSPLQTSEIAARRFIPESFLEQLFPQLRKAGIVASLRGPMGGHTLSTHPSQVTVGDVVRALEGSTLEVECGMSAKSCPLLDDCVIHEMWHEVQAAMEAVMDHTTIEELIQRESTRRGATMYYI